MSRKSKTHEHENASAVRRTPETSAQARREPLRQATPIKDFTQALTATPQTLAPTDILSLQRSVGTRAVQRLLSQQMSALLPRSETPANAIQRKIESEEERERLKTIESKETRTSLPDGLKAGLEKLSGIALDDVKVHYNSSAPAKVQAEAFTRGTDIHLGANGAHHLPHEAWHVVQQKQGRVKPTLQQ